MTPRKLFLAVFTVSGLMLAAAAGAQEDVKITTTEVAKGIFMLTGKGGNIGLNIGKDATFVIDDQFAPLTGKILDAIKAAGGGKPDFLINTHYHGDHTGGNENLGRGGTLIFAQDNVRERLSAPSFIKAFKMSTPARPKAALPVVTFSEDMTFYLNGERIHAFHVAHAHTDGDSVIHFVNANVIHTGDIFFNGFYPFIDVEHGGSLAGMIAAADTILSLADDRTKIIPGHGPLGDKAQLRKYRDMLSTALGRLKNLKESGKSVEEAVAAKPLADLEGEWGKGIFTGDRWIEVIYSGVY